MPITPGPWMMGRWSHGSGALWINSPTVHIGCVDGDSLDSEADARALAAVPKLIEACLAAEPHHQGGHSKVGALLREALKLAGVSLTPEQRLHPDRGKRLE